MRTSELEPVFILTCMRSFSSLISNMIGQHSKILTLPEINPFLANTMGEQIRQVSKTRPRTLHGLYRAIAELRSGQQDEAAIADAKSWMAERMDWSAVQLFDYFAETSGGQVLLDKSPSTVLKDDWLARAVRLFPKARFLHLYRHPVATTKSIAALTGAINDAYVMEARRKHPDPETSWFTSNRRIVNLLAHLPAHQVMAIKGEDILTQPDIYFQQICEWLGLDATDQELAAMKKPENSPFASIGPTSARFGNDPNFLKNPGYRARDIELPDLDTPLEWAKGRRILKSESILLARQMGYH